MRIKDILDWLSIQNKEVRFEGNQNIEIFGFSSLSNYREGTVTWIKKEESYENAGRPDYISLAIIQDGIKVDFENVIYTSESKEIFFSILHQFWGEEKKQGFVGEGTYISPEAVIDTSAYIGYNCCIDGKVRIGASTIIENNVVIQGDVSIGDRCHIQSLSVIGINGFGYSKNPATGEKTMVEHFGGVKIGNDVFIGSHVNIARGTIDDTIISDGTKIAPSTHIGHNNVIGNNATIICSNLFGSVRTGKEAYIVASTIQNQSQVGDHTVVGMGSIVIKPVPDNVVAFGIPAKVIKDNDTDL